MDVTSRIEAFFEEKGPLAQIFPDYLPRPGQIKMATSIAECLRDRRHLVVEAGTGVGKSFAYLAPLLLQPGKRDGPIVVSTGTIALQEQLVEKDLPLMARCLGRPLRFALAKGRNHYLCEHRLRRFQGQLESIVENEEDLKTLHKVEGMLGRGILSRPQLPGPLSAGAWSHIQSETGLCGHHRCREEPCSYLRMRTEWSQAEVIVVNHSLLFVHLQLARLGVSLLPGFRQLILDEAHHCPDTATEHFGIHVGNTQVRYLLDQLYGEKAKKGFLNRVRPDPALIKKKIVACRDLSETFFGALRFWLEHEAPENGRVRSSLPLENPLTPALEELTELLNHWAGSSENTDEEREFRYHAGRCQMMGADLQSFLTLQSKEAAHWVESRLLARQRIQTLVRSAPLDVSKTIQELIFRELDTVIMTSATLSTGESAPFKFYRQRMGVPKEGRELKVSSPFAYEKQVVLWSTEMLPAPTDGGWLAGLPRAILELLSWTAGGAFVLTTSHTVLRHLYEMLRPEAQAKGYHLLAQGITGDRGQLLDEFKKNPHSVLLGSSTFWEGIDIPGAHLRHVIIPRLPFEVPSHPLQEARVEQIESRGGSAFLEWALPQALIRFRQGFGRLVRRSEDLGLVSVLDSRLTRKRYGHAFLKSIPRCQHLVDVRPDPAFLNRMMPRDAWPE